MEIPWPKKPPVTPVIEHHQHLGDEPPETLKQSGEEEGRKPSAQAPFPCFLEEELDDYS